MKESEKTSITTYTLNQTLLFLLILSNLFIRSFTKLSMLELPVLRKRKGGKRREKERLHVWNTGIHTIGRTFVLLLLVYTSSRLDFSSSWGSGPTVLDLRPNLTRTGDHLSNNVLFTSCYLLGTQIRWQ